MGELPDVDEGGDAAQDQDGGAGEFIVEHFMKGPGGAGAAFIEGIHVDFLSFFLFFFFLVYLFDLNQFSNFRVYSGETSSARLTP